MVNQRTEKRFRYISLETIQYTVLIKFFFKIQYINNITRATLKIGTEDRRDYGHDEALCNHSPALQEDGRRPTVWHDSSE